MIRRERLGLFHLIVCFICSSPTCDDDVTLGLVPISITAEGLAAGKELVGWKQRGGPRTQQKEKHLAHFQLVNNETDVRERHRGQTGSRGRLGDGRRDEKILPGLCDAANDPPAGGRH